MTKKSELKNPDKTTDNMDLTVRVHDNNDDYYLKVVKARYFRNLHGISLALHKNISVFAPADERWVITELSTGAILAKSRTLKNGWRHVDLILRQYGLDFVKNRLKKFIDRYGAASENT